MPFLSWKKKKSNAKFVTSLNTSAVLIGVIIIAISCIHAARHCLQSFVIFDFFNPQNNPFVVNCFLPILQMGSLRFRGVKGHAQGHSIRRGHNETVSRRSRMQALASSISQCLLLFLLYLCLVLHKKKKWRGGWRGL